MGYKEFIFQGFTNRTHLDAINDLFNVTNIENVIVSAAYVSEGGVHYLADKLAGSAAKVSVFAGVRNEITSQQGLSKLLGLNLRDLYVVDTGSYMTTFHPKLYLVKGQSQARLIVGSANLTLGGLNNNVEASLLHHLDLGDADDSKLVAEIEEHFNNLPDEDDYKDHFIRITHEDQLEEMLKQGRVIDENVVRPPRQPKTSTGASSGDNVSLIKLKVPRLKRPPKKAAALAVAPPAPTPAPAALVPAAPVVAPPVPTPNNQIVAGANYEPFWESKPLSRRSLNIKTPGSTNPTGSTTLGKGLMDDIDPVTYFRRDIFGHLPWEDYDNRAGNPAQKVDADFDFFIKGVNVGRYTLTIRHSLTREAAAGEDKNLPTELSWNDAKPEIAKEDLLERTMILLRDVNDPNHFAVSID